MNDGPRFTVTVPEEGASMDALGFWRTVPLDGSYAVGDDRYDTTLWEVDLPQELGLSKQIMEMELERVHLTQHILPAAGDLMHAYLLNEQTPRKMEDENFSIPAVEDSPALAELSEWMMLADAEMDFSLTGDIEEKLRQAASELDAFTAQIRSSLSQMAVVQTTAGGRLIGATRVAWLGNVSTRWQPGLEIEQAALHRQSVEMTLTTRHCWIRLAGLVSVSATRLIAAASSGIGLVTALPMAYRTITQLVQEIRTLRQVQSRAV